MSLKTRLSKIWNKFEDLFLQNHSCLSCRKEIPDGTRFSLCKDCFDDLEILKYDLCEICGDLVLEDNKLCDRCKHVKYSFDRSNSFAFYEDTASKIVKRFKYNSKKYYAKNLSELMFLNKEFFEEIDFITFVPIGRKRLKERGFNQAEELARGLGRLSGIPVLETLEKLGSERHQAGLSQKERRENLSGTFALIGGAEKLIKDKNILLIDDVFTTGSTLSECSKALKAKRGFKPNKISCYTFAKTRFNSTNNGQIQQKNQKEIEIK